MCKNDAKCEKAAQNVVEKFGRAAAEALKVFTQSPLRVPGLGSARPSLLYML